MKIRIGVSIDEGILNRFRKSMNDNSLSLSPVIEALVELYLDKLEAEIDKPNQVVSDQDSIEDLR